MGDVAMVPIKIRRCVLRRAPARRGERVEVVAGGHARQPSEDIAQVRVTDFSLIVRSAKLAS